MNYKLSGRQPSTSGLSRRSLLLASGAAALSMGCQRQGPTAEPSDVLVLGAGLAGLHSAMLLEELGYRVTVLEASDHVGGRVQTRNYGGTMHELGASDIDVLYARVLDTARRLNLPLVPFGISVRPFSYHVGGTLLQAQQWQFADVNRTVGEERAIVPARLESHFINTLNPLAEIDSWLLPENALLDIPIGTYLREHGVSQPAVELLGHTYNGTGTQYTSALALFRDATRVRKAREAWQQRQKRGDDIPLLQQIGGGMQRLPEAMAASLQREVRLNHPVVAVEQDAAGVHVSCLNGSRFIGKRLVCSLPLTAMRTIDFRPGLSAAKRRATDQGEYYRTTKFYLRPTAAFWEQDEFEASLWSDGPVERVFALTDDSDQVHTLLVWINGPGSRQIDQLDPKAAGELVLDQLAHIRPASRGKLEIMGYHAWGRDAYIGGCGFSYAAGQVSTIARDLPLSEGRLHFAGEHTRRSESGMEAAMESAERVAQEIAFADMG